MLIAATPGDNAGLEFDLCRRKGGCRLGAWIQTVPPWGSCGAKSWLVACRADWEQCAWLPKQAVRGSRCFNDELAALALESYRPLAVQYNAAVLIAFWSGGSVYR